MVIAGCFLTHALARIGAPVLIRDRFERSGMRWAAQTAEALLKLRAAHLSDDLPDYWEHHIQQDQQRLYQRNARQPEPSS